jgi:hypothetical protein
MVTNVFLFSRIWYSIRTAHPRQSFFQQICSVFANFLKYKIFHRWIFKTIIDPAMRKVWTNMGPAMQNSVLSIAIAYSNFPIDTNDPLQEFFVTDLMRCYLCVLMFSLLPILFYFFQKVIALILKLECFQSTFSTFD